MNQTNIPLKDKFDKLVAGLAALEPVALELSRDAVHSASPHIAPLLGRIRGGIESVNWHVKFLAAQPDPAPAAATQPQPATVPDAKAGTPAK